MVTLDLAAVIVWLVLTHQSNHDSEWRAEINAQRIIIDYGLIWGIFSVIPNAQRLKCKTESFSNSLAKDVAQETTWKLLQNLSTPPQFLQYVLCCLDVPTLLAHSVLINVSVIMGKKRIAWKCKIIQWESGEERKNNFITLPSFGKNVSYFLLLGQYFLFLMLAI